MPARDKEGDTDNAEKDRQTDRQTDRDGQRAGEGNVAAKAERDRTTECSIDQVLRIAAPKMKRCSAAAEQGRGARYSRNRKQNPTTKRHKKGPWERTRTKPLL